MKKNISQKLAAGMAVSMGALSMMGSVAPVFANSAPVVVGESGDQADINGLTATITATGITEDGVTVKAYQLVDGYYNDNNLIKYVVVDQTNGAIADVEKPTADEITAIANNIGNGSFGGEEITMSKNAEGDYVADVEPGLYLILVSGANDTVFNPAIVAVNVSDANNPIQVEGGEVSLTDFFKVNETSAYIKSSKSDMDKNIVDEDGADVGLGNTGAVGDIIYFKLDNMTIPSFSDDYVDPVYKITDVLEGGMFDTISNLVVKMDGVILPASDGNVTNYILSQEDDVNGFVITFTSDFLKAHAADATRPSIEVTYQTKLLESAGMNFAENVNHAKVEYSNNPNDSTSFKEIVENTYSYTFAINGLVDGEANANDKNDDMNKIEYAQKNGDTKAERYALAGATFAISKNEDMSDPFDTSVSDADGRFEFSGLAEGVYYIKETKAPAGYALNDNMYRVSISAEIDSATGIMTSYSIITESKASNGSAWEAAGSAVYTNTIDEDAVSEDDGSVTNNVSSNVTTVDIVNSKIQTLPSTGGAGTAMAFAVSAGLAAATGGIVVTAKKKSRK